MKTKTHKVLSAGLVLGAFLSATAMPVFSALAVEEPTVKVTIDAFVNGQMATAQNTNNTTFQMDASWNATNIGSGSGQYALSATGFNSQTPYEAVTTDMSSGAAYSTNVVVDGSTVGLTCDPGDNQPSPLFKLNGYTSGDTLAEASAATGSMTAPSFTAMTGNKVVIAWLSTCAEDNEDPAMHKIHIMQYIDGSEATASIANNYLFPMTATWTAANQNGGAQTSGNFTLGNGSDSNHLYQYSSVAFQEGADYTTAAVTNDMNSGSLVLANGSQCEEGRYVLNGYRSSPVSFALAANGSLSTSAPTFTDLDSDQYIIVYDTRCADDSGTIGGDVEGGVEPGELAVTSIQTVQGTATADGTFENGWKYKFHITVPEAEQNLSMKFGNWMNNANSSSIGASNIRISSMQADNNNAAITVSAADTYTTPSLHMTVDMNPNLPGKQVEVLVEIKVPSTTLNGSYTTNYSVRTLP